MEIRASSKTAEGGAVWCVGEAMAQVTPTDGRTLETARTFQVSVAGAESNVALNLAALGRSAAWYSRLGEDPLGRRVGQHVAAAGVDTSRVVIDPIRSTGIVAKDPSPTASSVYYYRRGSAASAMNPRDAPVIFGAVPMWIHVTGVTPALSRSCRALTHRLLTGARRQGIGSSFDVNYRPALWRSRSAAARTLGRLASLADVVFVGRDEAEMLWGTDTAASVRDRLPRPSTLVVKDGGVEAVTFAGGEIVAEPALTVEAVEPVGAGDAFAAGWLHGHLENRAQGVKIRLGHLMAARAMTSLSDQPPDPVPDSYLERAERGWHQGTEY